MRLLLDAHLSGRRIARPLRERGHDVRAADEHPELESCPDEELLALATREDRIVVTLDVSDFPAILRRWAEEGKDHAGCAVIFGVRPEHFGPILRALDQELAANPDQETWRNRSAFLSPAT